MAAPRCTYRLVTPPPSGRGAIAVIDLAGDVEDALGKLAVATVRVGEVRLRSIAGVDEGLVARWSQTSASLMPHGGPAVVRAILQALRDAGLRAAQGGDPQPDYPEATTLLEARMLEALALAASPLAVDLLLDQPRRWVSVGERGDQGSPDDLARWRRLNRLIDPPLVVALGPPNIGKSTLLNTLAGRSVSLVADAPGTTRDHVGVALDLGGVVVRYLDTPGIGRASPERPIDTEAEAVAQRLAAGADLVVLCEDPTARAVEPPAGMAVLRVGLRSDLGMPAGAVDVAVSAVRGEGLEALVSAMRERLVPKADLDDPRPWKFW